MERASVQFARRGLGVAVLASMTLRPSLSIVVNNYNYARYLPEALESALGQLGERDEIIVVDDGSTDDSAEVLSRYAENPHMTVILQRNQGQFAAVLNGLAAARGDLCVLLDSDDYLLPGYLSRLRTTAEERLQEDFFFSAAEPGGDSVSAAEMTRATLARMALPEGPTGASRWGTWVAGEFLGTPTSGLALRASLVETILAMREQLDDRLACPAWAVHVFRMNTSSHIVSRLSADGIIVRASSLLGARKYCMRTPGFFYRIHGGNAFAGLGTLARLYLRFKRGKQVVRMVGAAMDIPSRPTVRQVLLEAGGRSAPLRVRRRITLWLNYSRALLCTADAIPMRFTALLQLPWRLFRHSKA